MTCDQHDLADAAETLRGEYAELHFAKSRQVIREARVTAPRPGPSAPSPTRLLSLQVDLEARLLEMVCEVRDKVRPGELMSTGGQGMCEFIRKQAGPASSMPVGADLLAELREQSERIKHVLKRLPGRELTEDEIRAARVKKHLMQKYADLLPGP